VREIQLLRAGAAVAVVAGVFNRGAVTSTVSGLQKREESPMRAVSMGGCHVIVESVVQVFRWACVLLLLAAGSADAVETADQGLFQLLNDRLALMEQVAAHKWRNDLPIEDRSREAQVVASSVDKALRVGVMPDSAAALFRTQIAAAKEVQAYWFARWREGAGPPQAPDLVAVTRPQLLALGEQIIDAAAVRPRVGSRAEFDAAIRVPGLTAATRDALYQAFAGLKFFADRLQQILATGRLRVGTTGDYPPFSDFAAQTNAYTGIDIDLAQDLARALGVQATFVQTSWPTLMDDLSAGAFDIAMSGVSRTMSRQRVGFLSQPYYVGGKTPVARCDRADEFDSLERIDRAGARLIVNPGGTNEAFVRQHIRRAEVVVYPDNRTIFEQIIEDKADLMITDRVEVELQVARHPELCATMAGTLNYQEKAFLLPQDPVWSEFVATWLSLRLADGTVAAIFRRHGAEPGSVASDFQQAGSGSLSGIRQSRANP